jgi:hypothetical protein
MRWEVPVELSQKEQKVCGRLRRTGGFYVFLREVRHELFDDAFQAELEQAYGKARGTAPLPPAMLAMVTLLQAYDSVGDANAVETVEMDKRWQLVLGCLGREDAPFSQGVLVSFRKRMIEHDLDRKLLDRTVELAKRSGKFGWQRVKAALDSSPLLGAGRVEDTFNLVGRALSTVVDCAAKALRVPRQQILDEAKLTLLGSSSIKAALDINWDEPSERAAALGRLLDEVRAVEAWVARRSDEVAHDLPLQRALELLRKVIEQDIEPDPAGGGSRIRRGVAHERVPSVGDPEMRHGRKSKSHLFNGFKRHVMQVQSEIIVGAMVLPANRPEHEALPLLRADLERHVTVEELQIDRGYLSSPAVAALRAQGVAIRSKPWRVGNHGRYTKEHFAIALDEKKVTCPAGTIVAIQPTRNVVRFPEKTCATCAQRPRCTTSSTGRTLTLHPQEDLLVELRTAMRSSDGRKALRERVSIEHRLAAVGQIQGTRARYKGVRKNTLDLRRCATVANLQTLRRHRRDEVVAA